MARLVDSRQSSQPNPEPQFSRFGIRARRGATSGSPPLRGISIGPPAKQGRVALDPFEKCGPWNTYCLATADANNGNVAALHHPIGQCSADPKRFGHLGTSKKKRFFTGNQIVSCPHGFIFPSSFELGVHGSLILINGFRAFSNQASPSVGICRGVSCCHIIECPFHLALNIALDIHSVYNV